MATVDSMADTELGTIETNIPARLDRLPWSRWHWKILVGLGTVWILDGLEVTIVGSIAGAISAKGSGINISSAEVAGWAASMYVAGACFGALLFGQLTDRFGRKKLFMITLGVYLAATMATAFAWTPLFFFACRFVTGMGIGGEYSAINSAVDELIPANHRGRIDILINGTYWAGAAAGALLSVAALHIFSPLLSWRVCFGLGFVLGIAILFVRRHVPESPRWLFIHGREDEAEEITRDIERQVEESTGKPLEDPDPEDEIAIRQRKTISLVEIARTVVKTYPKRTVLGLALFIGQAFLYNSILFGYATLLSTFFHVATANAPYYLVAFAVGNLLGPVILGGLFDSVGRRPMIAGTYILSGVLLLVTGYLFEQHQLNATTLTVVVVGRVLLRLGGGQRRVPDGLGDLPAGDARALHRAVLRGRHRPRRDHRSAVVRADGRDRQGVGGVQGAGDRRDLDDRRWRDRDRVRRGRRAARARVDRQAVDRGRLGRAGRRGARRLRRAAALVLRHPTVRGELVLAIRLARRIWDGRGRGVIHPGYVRGLARIRRCAGIGVDRHGRLVRRRGCGGLVRLRDLQFKRGHISPHPHNRCHRDRLPGPFALKRRSSSGSSCGDGRQCAGLADVEVAIDAVSGARRRL